MESYQDNPPMPRHSLQFVFELDECMESGQPFIQNAWFTASMMKNANLRKFLEEWVGKEFSSDQMKDKDLVKKFLGKQCELFLVAKGEKVSIGSVGRIKPGAQRLQVVNEILYYDLSSPDESVFAKLSDKLKDRIYESTEYQRMVAEAQAKLAAHEPRNAQEVLDQSKRNKFSPGNKEIDDIDF